MNFVELDYYLFKEVNDVMFSMKEGHRIKLHRYRGELVRKKNQCEKTDLNRSWREKNSLRLYQEEQGIIHLWKELKRREDIEKKSDLFRH